MPRGKQSDEGASLSNSRGPIARRLSGPTPGLPRPPPTPGDLRPTLHGRVPRPRGPGASPDPSRWAPLRLKPTNAAALASRPDLDRQAIRSVLGPWPWGQGPLLEGLNRRVAAARGRPDAGLVVDPSAVPTPGAASVGVPRPGGGRGARSRTARSGATSAPSPPLSPSRSTSGSTGPRRGPRTGRAARDGGSPRRPATARDPHGGRRGSTAAARARRPAGSAAPPRGAARRGCRKPAARTGRDLVAVPSPTGRRDLAAEPPPSGGPGRRPKVPVGGVRARGEPPPAGAGTRLTVPAGEKGPREAERGGRRGAAKVGRRVGGVEESVVVVRHEARDARESDDHPSRAGPPTSLEEGAWGAEAEHRIEGCLTRGRSAAGLGDPQGGTGGAGLPLRRGRRSGRGPWSVRPAGGRKAAAVPGPPGRAERARIVRKAWGGDPEARSSRERTRWLGRNERARGDRSKARNQLPPLKNSQYNPLGQ